jgi:hypothetical protein
MVGCAVDRFNYATDRRFDYTPMLNHDHSEHLGKGSILEEYGSNF